MELYQNKGGDSGVHSYEYGDNFIRIQFTSGSIYLYTESSTGSHDIEIMKQLADQGKGLNAYINTNIKKRFEAREA